MGGKATADDQKVDLKGGNPVPIFGGTDDRGVPWKSADRGGKKYVVV